ncbi:hypothetical protein A3852_13030 [Rhodococcus qingshengii]|nr:hypothetical protein A3852_13030 [Rhodococcus qingshengii]
MNRSSQIGGPSTLAKVLARARLIGLAKPKYAHPTKSMKTATGLSESAASGEFEMISANNRADEAIDRKPKQRTIFRQAAEPAGSELCRSSSSMYKASRISSDF